MTHIFIFNNASRAANYGIGTYVRQLSDGLAALADTNVSFVEMFADTKEFAVSEDEKGCRHYQIPALPSGMESEIYCRSIFYFLARKINADSTSSLVFQFNYFQHRPLAALLKGQYPDCRIVLTVHYLNWCFELKGNLTRLRKMTARDFHPTDEQERRILSSVTDEKAFLHLADEVLVLSRNTREVLAKDYDVPDDKMHLIYNGLGDMLCTRSNKQDSLRNILFVGRLDEIKGLRYLIGAFGKIAGRHLDTRLLIVGDGDFQPYLAQGKNMIGRVSFLGRMQSDEVEESYKSAYLGVMPSFHEQCSYTAIEMMRHGIPIVGTDSTGLGEMLDATPHLRVHIDEDNFNEDDFVDGIAACLDLLLSDSDAYRQAADAVSALYESRYRVTTMARGIQQTVLSSFCRKGYTVSPDYLRYMDNRMMQLVNKRPDIDTDFFGMSGIGIYLWWRIEELGKRPDGEFQMALLQEFLIYYLDWLHDAASTSALPEEMISALMNMKDKAFYKTKVLSILGMHSSNGKETLPAMPSEKEITKNALRICNCKV